MKKIRLIFTMVVIVFFGVATFEKVLAEESQESPKGFSMSPFFQEVNLNRDQDQSSFVLEISNNTQTSAMFKLSVLDFGSLDETGGVAFLGSGDDFKNKYSLASWVSLEKDAVILEAGEKQSVKVTIENKESLSPGGHYAAVMAKMVNEDNGSGSESSIIALDPSFASLIFVRKIGGEIFNLNLVDQEIEKNPLSLPSNVKLRFQNTGNVHVSPRGIVRLIDPFGKEISKGIINQESAIILPETFRKFTTELSQNYPIFFPGRYQLSVEYRFDGKDDFETRQQYFYFFPIKIMLITFGLVVLIIFGWKKFNKREVKVLKKVKTKK